MAEVYMSKIKEGVVDICIPTWNNEQQLADALNTLNTNTTYLKRLFIVNNGEAEIEFGDGITVLNPKENLGWEKGVNLAARHGKGEFILLCNDDVIFLPGQYDWLKKLVDIMKKDDTVAMVGPSSNVVMGSQNIWTDVGVRVEVPYLIGFCMLVRRSVFEKLGGLDESLPGGDDLDLSIRVTDMGMKMVACKDSFVYHIGFQTGTRIKGDEKQTGGWNSPEMTAETQVALIKKHGVIKFHRTWYGVPVAYIPQGQGRVDVEKGLFKGLKGRGVDIGCGVKKKVKGAIGVDIVPKDKVIDVGGQKGKKSIADVTASGDELPMFKDGEMDYVTASHVLEHFLDPIKALKEWKRILKTGGKLIIALPDAGTTTTMHLDDTHRHDFSIESAICMLEMVGFKVDDSGRSMNDEWSIYLKVHK